MLTAVHLPQKLTSSSLEATSTLNQVMHLTRSSRPRSRVSRIPTHLRYQIFKDPFDFCLQDDPEEKIVTFGHPENTYTGKKADPMTLDYIFVKSTSEKAEIIAMEQTVKETEFQ